LILEEDKRIFKTTCYLDCSFQHVPHVRTKTRKKVLFVSQKNRQFDLFNAFISFDVMLKDSKSDE